MRILVTSTLYPPIAVGGYERECAVVVERLRRDHDVLVLTTDATLGLPPAPPQPDVRRELPALTPDWRGALRAPAATLRAVKAARRALQWRPDLVYAWNGTSFPQAVLRVLADSGVPMAFRVCEHWFGRLFTGDQFLRELLPARRSLPRAAWSLGCRALDRLPSLRLDPGRRFPAAISWNSEAIRRMAGVPPSVEPVLERICHSVPYNGAAYDGLRRDPAPEPEIAFIGRVTPAKGVNVAIEALAELQSRHGITARLVVAGPEEEGHGEQLRELAAARGVADRVDWRGPLERDGVAAVLSRAHALIVPSVWQEPFPLVTIEGAFARVPIVAADVGGVGEGMRDGEHALLYPATDPAAAADALRRALTEKEETAARVERAYRRAQDFRLEPYLEAQARFVLDAHEAVGRRARSA